MHYNQVTKNQIWREFCSKRKETHHVKGNPYKSMSAFLSRNLLVQERVGWYIKSAERKTNYQPRTLYPAKLPLTNEVEIPTGLVKTQLLGSTYKILYSTGLWWDLGIWTSTTFPGMLLLVLIGDHTLDIIKMFSSTLAHGHTFLSLAENCCGRLGKFCRR